MLLEDAVYLCLSCGPVHLVKGLMTEGVIHAAFRHMGHFVGGGIGGCHILRGTLLGGPKDS